MKKGSIKQETGLTLAEVLASIVLISIIMLLFIMIFSQYFKTTNESEEVISATYIAQAEMEYLFELSKTSPLTEVEGSLLEKGYTNLGQSNDWIVFEKKEEYKLLLKIKNHQEEDHLVPVTVEVYDSSTDQLEVKMEHLLEWME